MDTKLATTTDFTKSVLPPMFTATHFEYELAFLTEHDVPFNIIYKEGDYVRIEVDANFMTSYGIAMKSCGYRMATHDCTNNLSNILKSVA